MSPLNHPKTSLSLLSSLLYANQQNERRNLLLYPPLWVHMKSRKQTLQPKKEREAGRKSVLPSYEIDFSLKQKHTVLKTCRNIRIIRRISFFRNMFINTINKITKNVNSTSKCKFTTSKRKTSQMVLRNPIFFLVCY